MTTRWHNLSPICLLTAIVMSGSACGGRSEDGTHSGMGGAAGAGSGHGGSAPQGGTPAQGGSPAQGGTPAQGGQAGAANQCIAITDAYAQAMAEARRCNPALSIEQCTASIVEGLACGCDTFVNPANSAALERAKQQQTLYAQQRCGIGIACGACLPPVRAFCSGEGLCVDVYAPAARGCKVAGHERGSGT